MSLQNKTQITSTVHDDIAVDFMTIDNSYYLQDRWLAPTHGGATPYQWHLCVSWRYDVLKQRLGAASIVPAHTIIAVGPPRTHS